MRLKHTKYIVQSVGICGRGGCKIRILYFVFIGKISFTGALVPIPCVTLVVQPLAVGCVIRIFMSFCTIVAVSTAVFDDPFENFAYQLRAKAFSGCP